MLDLEQVVSRAPIFLLVYARCFAMILTMPLFSMRSISRIAKLALAGYMAFFIYGSVDYGFYSTLVTEDQVFSLNYILILVGEALIGIVLGFYIQIIFAAFSSAGQFTAFQMGFSAASTYDALSQVENPLLGQFFNFMAMLIFMQASWFQKMFLGGLQKSFEAINVFALINGRETIMKFMLRGLTKLFSDALIISLPIMGTLLLITVCTGLLSKAAPQMNLLSEGFPIMIITAFLVILTMIPSLCDFFMRSFSNGFVVIDGLFKNLAGGS